MTHSFSASHPMFPGHFPGYPIVPGAYLLALVQREADARLRAQGERRCVTGVRAVKFMQPLRPEQAFDIAFTAAGNDGLRFSVKLGATVHASGTLQLGTSSDGAR
jgi:3-hydroxymyristoyl/3-hydroxydecanoyl-(acyl carrier protein) dehydratase